LTDKSQRGLLSHSPCMGLRCPWVDVVISHPRGGPQGQPASTLGYPRAGVKPTADLVGSAASENPRLDDGGPCAVPVDSSDGLGPLRAQPGRVGAQPCGPLCALAGPSTARRASTVWSTDAASVGGGGHNCPVLSARYLPLVAYVWADAQGTHRSGTRDPAGREGSAPGQSSCRR
jgi:hypothetical protein